ncbi:MAG: helix-turn-helix transcriptional regulator [Desulfobulbaceae bacterium]|nr:helix-turn-helix transcriptional regulator [Desulfobulbaceae bacterium]
MKNEPTIENLIERIKELEKEAESFEIIFRENKERVKELNCLYSISRIVEEAEESVDQIMQNIVDIIPSSWQYPQITCAKITLKEGTYKTVNFKKSKWVESTPINIHGKKAGIVEVFYMEEKLTLYEGPFLKEERALLDAIAERVGRIIERIDSKKTLLEYKNAIEGSKDFIVTVDSEYRYLFANRAYIDLRNLKNEEVVGKTIEEVVGKGLFEKTIKNNLDKCFAKNEIVLDQTSIEFPNHGARDLEIRYEPVKINGRLKSVSIIARDTTELHRKNRHLAEVNIALKVLLEQKNADRAMLGENMIMNIKEMITPYVEKLKTSGLRQRQKTFIEIIESNLTDIISPFVGKLSSKYYSLTPMEIKIATLVKGGRTNKGIAELLNLSTNTILTHRYHLRKKLGLKNKKINLRSHLLSLHI